MSRQLAPVEIVDNYYRPPWYPNRDPHHNPWAVSDRTLVGESNYEVWSKSLPPGELLRLIAEHEASAA